MIHSPDARFLTVHPYQIRSIHTYGDFVDLYVLFFYFRATKSRAFDRLANGPVAHFYASMHHHPSATHNSHPMKALKRDRSTTTRPSSKAIFDPVEIRTNDRRRDERRQAQQAHYPTSPRHERICVACPASG